MEHKRVPIRARLVLRCMSLNLLFVPETDFVFLTFVRRRLFAREIIEKCVVLVVLVVSVAVAIAVVATAVVVAFAAIVALIAALSVAIWAHGPIVPRAETQSSPSVSLRTIAPRWRWQWT